MEHKAEPTRHADAVKQSHRAALSITLCCPAYIPAVDYGGPIATVAALAAHLGGAGHELAIWTADFGMNRSRVPRGVRSVAGTQVRYFRRIAAYRWSPLVPGAYRAAAHNNVKIGHLFGFRDGLTVPAGSGYTRARIPYVVEPMGMFEPRIRSIAIKRLFDALIGSRYIRRAAGIIATSDLEAGEIRAALPNCRVWVRPNPVEIPQDVQPNMAIRNELGVADDELLVAYVGRVSTKKGLDTLATALGSVPRVHAVVVGPDARDGGEAQLSAAVSRNRVSGRVHRLPALWGKNKDQLVAACDAFALPSRSENFGNAVAEACALGVPTIVTDACGVASLVNEYDAGLVVRHDVDELAGALRTMRDDPILRRRLGENGPLLARSLSPETIGAQQEAIYREVLG